MRMEDVILGVFKDYLIWVYKNRIKDNIDNYMKYLEMDRKLNIFKYEGFNKYN